MKIHELLTTCWKEKVWRRFEAIDEKGILLEHNNIVKLMSEWFWTGVELIDEVIITKFVRIEHETNVNTNSDFTQMRLVIQLDI